MQIRGLRAALNSSNQYKYKTPGLAADFAVIGGGVIGLAIAQRLSVRFPNKTTYLVERHPRAGEETSSRNSEVIHSGLYYPEKSLKTRLCLRGRHLLYERCQSHNIPHRKTGKLVTATAEQVSYIEKLHAKSKTLPWPHHTPQSLLHQPVLPTQLITGDEAREMEPNLSKNIVAALWCPETGIVSSHGLMESLEKDIIDSDNAELVYSTRVVRVDPYDGSSTDQGSESGWVVQTVTEGSDDAADAFLARTLINASGLNGPLVLNSLLPEEARIPMYYARGSYASYRGPGAKGISTLIYPCPPVGPRAHGFESLGTHLTLDLEGNVRFGPDIQWLSPPSGHDAGNIDYWEKHLVADESRLQEMHQAVKEYLPGVVLPGFRPDYVGIRPKIVPPGFGFQDFVIRTDHPGTFLRRDVGQRAPMISLLGIESPGLTASLAIAEYVVDDLLHTL